MSRDTGRLNSIEISIDALTNLVENIDLNQRTYDPEPDLADTNNLSKDLVGNLTLGAGSYITLDQLSGGTDYIDVGTYEIGGFSLKPAFAKKQFINWVELYLKWVAGSSFNTTATIYDVTDDVVLGTNTQSISYTTSYGAKRITFTAPIEIDPSHEIRVTYSVPIAGDEITMDTTNSDVLADSVLVGADFNEISGRDAKFSINWADRASSGELVETILVTSIESWKKFKSIIDEPANTGIQFDITDSSDNVILSDVQDNDDISSLDIKQYKSIKLKATFTGDGTSTPKLFYRALSWIGNVSL